MEALSQQFIDSCRTERGFILRGESMTRIEVFVDAAFAFAVTMLVISIDQIPANMDELIDASKLIPAFAAAVFQLMWIWFTHSTWSKRFGLEDGYSIFLSVLLIILVLVYIYPLKILFMGFFSWLSAGYLPTQFEINSWDELRHMFAYFAAGFFVINSIYVLMYRHAMKLSEPLKLTDYEIHSSTKQIKINTALAGLGLFGILAPYLLPNSWVVLAGFVYSLIWPIYEVIERASYKQWQARSNSED